MIDYKCNYCDAVFQKRTERGACPCCGGPNSKRVEYGSNEIERGFTYVDNPNKRIPYYTPNKITIKSRVFKKLGFRVTLVASIVILTLVVYSFCMAFKVGYTSNLSDEQLRRIPPTIQAIQPDSKGQGSLEEWWNTNFQNWLSPQDALNLRNQRNVTNLVILDSDEIKISSDKTLELDRVIWKQSKPYFLEGLNVEGTTVQVKIDGTVYNINVLMPFVWSSEANQVSIIDFDGSVWTLVNVIQTKVVEIGKLELPFEISPNPNLVIPFTKQQ